LRNKFYTGLSENFDEENETAATEQKKFQGKIFAAKQKAQEANAALRETPKELADLEQGILHYPDAPRELRTALEKAGIEAYFLPKRRKLPIPHGLMPLRAGLTQDVLPFLSTPPIFKKLSKCMTNCPALILICGLT